MTSLVRTKPATDESGTSARSPHTLTCLLRKGTQDSIRSTLTCTLGSPGKRERERMFNKGFGNKMKGLKEYSGDERALISGVKAAGALLWPGGSRLSREWGVKRGKAQRPSTDQERNEICTGSQEMLEVVRKEKSP